MAKLSKLAKIREQMEKDTSLPLLKDATRLVFGDGNIDAEIMFIGEGPGYHEDQKGIPFIGNAGSFLNKLLASINLDRDSVFITNVVHHRPPNNRDPLPSELAAYGKYLDQIIAAVDPKVIVTLGRFSMGKFLPGVTITTCHGIPSKVSFKGKDVLIVPMYHPAAGLRNGEIKRRTIDDFSKLPAILETHNNEEQTKLIDKMEAKQIPLI